ncbi:MAG: 3-deoxy-manno-octulosonate cytidylyltransferase [Kangiellaceae bacterium]|nr:3-deoxy-manno-octulosonate cytidylyltransferase [Kangiellaceae bacterium]
MIFHVIIPARYQSTRLPGKPLSMIGDLTMIERVCHQAKQSGATSVTVATDNDEILDVVKQAGFNAVMTREDHVSGSDRIFEAAELIGLSDDAVIVNVQGDEPFIPSENIVQVAGLLKKNNARMATLCCEIDAEEAGDANAVKAIYDKNNKAIYFSRSKIPFVREPELSQQESVYYRHIGIYAYTKSLLGDFVKWPESHLESLEKLEQLRVIENGESIYIDVLKTAPPAGIDTPADLARANQFIK